MDNLGHGMRNHEKSFGQKTMEFAPEKHRELRHPFEKHGVTLEKHKELRYSFENRSSKYRDFVRRPCVEN